MLHLEDLVFSSEIPAIQEQVDKLGASGVNKIIALGHSGIKVDTEIARMVRGVDVVIGGHTNTFLYSGNILNCRRWTYCLQIITMVEANSNV